VPEVCRPELPFRGAPPEPWTPACRCTPGDPPRADGGQRRGRGAGGAGRVPTPRLHGTECAPFGMCVAQVQESRIRAVLMRSSQGVNRVFCRGGLQTSSQTTCVCLMHAWPFNTTVALNHQGVAEQNMSLLHTLRLQKDTVGTISVLLTYARE